MTTPLARHRLRLKFDTASHALVTDDLTSTTPEIWRGTDLQIEVGIFVNGTIIDSKANIDHLVLEIHGTRDGAALWSQEIAAASMDVTISAVDWATKAEAKRNALFTLTCNDTQFDMTDSVDSEKTFWVVCHVYTTDAPDQYYTCGGGNLIVEEDAAQNVGLSPVTTGLRVYRGWLYVANADYAGDFNRLVARGSGTTRTLDIDDRVTL